MRTLTLVEVFFSEFFLGLNWQAIPDSGHYGLEVSASRQIGAEETGFDETDLATVKP
jgi:hypothetical protein